MSASSKPWLVLAGVLAVALGGVGLFTGAIGAAFFGSQQLLGIPRVELAAPTVFHVAGIGISNTILSSWFTTLVLIAVLALGMRRQQLVPKGIQNFVEWILESLYNFIVGVAGERWARPFFPVIATIFLFVSFNAWLALLPFYQSVGFMHNGQIETHLFRSAGTDLNMPLAVALVSGIFVEYFGFKAHGFGYLGEFIRVQDFIKGLRHFSVMDIFTGLVDGAVGLLELLSHFIRIVSFTFRLFGNMTAGEIVLMVSAFLVSFIFPMPFYGLELLVGFIQALIFAGLSLAFVAVAVDVHGDEA